MANEQATKRTSFGYQILLWLTGVETLSPARLDEMQIEWEQYLLTGPARPTKTPDEVFEELMELREMM